MKITPKSIDTFVADFKKAVQQLEEQYNVSIDMGRVSYSSTDFSSKVTVTSKSDDALNEKKRVFENDAMILDLKVPFNSEIVIDKATYKVVGINWRSKKYPVELINIESGKGIGASVKYIMDLAIAQGVKMSTTSKKFSFGEEVATTVTMINPDGSEKEIAAKSISAKSYTIDEAASRTDQIKSVIEQGCEKSASVIAKVLDMNPSYVQRILKSL